MKTKKTETEKDLCNLRFCTRTNKGALWVLTITLFYGVIFAIILSVKIIISIIQLFEPEEMISKVMILYSYAEEWISGIMIGLIIISSFFIIAYYTCLKIFEKSILRVMLNEKIKEWYENGKLNKHSTYIFKYFYRLYDSNKLKSELTPKEKSIFMALNEVFYADSFCLDDMEGFNYDLFNKSFKDILIELCNDPSSKGIDCTIKHYKKELDSKKLKKINKTFWKIQNRITINLNLLLFKAFLLFSMIAWIVDNIINYPGDYGPFGANYFNICAVVLLGIDVWERRKDLFFLRNLDEIEMNDKKE